MNFILILIHAHSFLIIGPSTIIVHQIGIEIQTERIIHDTFQNTVSNTRYALSNAVDLELREGREANLGVVHVKR